MLEPTKIDEDLSKSIKILVIKLATDKFTYKRPWEEGRSRGSNPPPFFSLIPRTLFVIPKISENIEIIEN